MNAIIKLFKKIPVNYRFAVCVVLGFLGMISFFSVNSPWADANHINGLLKVVGSILCGLVVLIFIAANAENKD